MNTRVQRIEETLRRAIADTLLFGLRDPRLQTTQVSVTGVRVTPDLQQAKIFVDIIDPSQSKSVLAALRSATPVIRSEVAKKVHLRRVPTLSFEKDLAIERGLRIESVLAEIRAENGAEGGAEDSGDDPA